MLSWAERIRMSKQGFQQLRLELRKLKDGFLSGMDRAGQAPTFLFKGYFNRYADQAGVPLQLRNGFCAELFSVRNNPQAGQRVAEKYFSQYPFNWPQGTEDLKKEGKKGTYKQHCRLFAGKVCGGDISAQSRIQTLSASSKFFPYVKIRSGPAENPCPIHSKYFDKSISRNHPALQTEFGEHPDCKCWIQNVRKTG